LQVKDMNVAAQGSCIQGVDVKDLTKQAAVWRLPGGGGLTRRD